MSSQVSSTSLPMAPARIRWARIVGGAVLLEALLVALLTPIGLVFGSPFLEGSTDTTVFLVAVPAGCFIGAAIVSGWLFRHVTYRAVLQGGLLGVAATMLYLLLCLGAPGGLPGAIAGYGMLLFCGTQALRIIGGAVGPAYRQATRAALLGVVLLLACGFAAAAQDLSKTYTDSRGRQIVFRLGDASFADEVVSFTVGKPPPRDSRWAEPRTALGPPDFNPRRVDPAAPTNVVLGCAGTLTVRFTDNVLVDIPGPDLYVFEVGPAIEPMSLAISPDGETWTTVGDIRGGTAEIDISKVSMPGERFRFVRVTDLKRACNAPYPGADVDAIGAALQLSFDASVLFDFDRSALLPAAQSALVDAARQIAAYPNAAVIVEGHTDNVGTNGYNAKLSQARAEAVRRFLLSRPELKGRRIAARGLGATRPIAANDSDAGRQQNRRVEIVINPNP